MKLERQSDGWWIVGVPPYTVDGVTCDTCGPYPTKADALDDMRGLTEFFDRHPEYTPAPPLLEVGEVREGTYASHWFVKSLAYRPPRLGRVRRPKSSPGQMTLPGMDELFGTAMATFKA